MGDCNSGWNILRITLQEPGQEAKEITKALLDKVRNEQKGFFEVFVDQRFKNRIR